MLTRAELEPIPYADIARTMIGNMLGASAACKLLDAFKLSDGRPAELRLVITTDIKNWIPYRASQSQELDARELDRIPYADIADTLINNMSGARDGCNLLAAFKLADGTLAELRLVVTTQLKSRIPHGVSDGERLARGRRDTKSSGAKLRPK